MYNKIFISNKELENLSLKDKIKYFNTLKNICINNKVSSDNLIVDSVVTKISPFLRNYNYEIIGKENIPSDGKGLFVCNHSNSHDFFTAHEVFNKLGTNVSVFAASDDLGLATRFIFNSCNAVLIDRNSRESINEGIIKFSSNLIAGIPGVIFGEATWNLHPFRPMQQIKIGSAKISAITELPIIPTIFEYVEYPKVCRKEKELYSKCIVNFGKPIIVSRNENLVKQTNNIQFVLEKMRLSLWKEIGTERSSILDINKEIYLNHTYLKKYDAFGYTYDSLGESKYLFSNNKQPVENEFCINEKGEFGPGVTKKVKRLKR